MARDTARVLAALAGVGRVGIVILHGTLRSRAYPATSLTMVRM
jgi:hypothetical protein